MPLARGYVTSDYGQRSMDYHTGIDFSNRSVSNVYPVANGRVVHITYGSTSTCGNHIVYVYHNIGSGYTTSYWHLTNANVTVGQNVTPNTVLGQTGGAGYTDGQYYNGKYVQCAYGGHVHLNLFRGLTTTNSGRINPRILMPQIPSEGTYFTR
jgi:murein DD-endopeptidase MepM/ murein hydrolase activator NlpD